jgi:hypothetical protein
LDGEELVSVGTAYGVIAIAITMVLTFRHEIAKHQKYHTK